MSDSIEDVLRQMRAAGIVPPESLKVGVGKITRFGKKARSWYIVHEHHLRNGRTVLVGAFGDWSMQVSQKIEVDWKGIDPSDRRQMEADMAAREKREAEKRERQAHGAAWRARGQWRRALSIEDAESKGVTSAYLFAKGITAESVKYANDNGQPDGTILIAAYVPADGGGSTMVGLQKIAPDGTKRFNAGMAKKGAAAMIGKRPKDGDLIFVAEGYATGRTVRTAQPEHPVACAFDCGNLVPVAEALRAAYPTSPLIFLADDDWNTDGNPGVSAAHAAARRAGNAWVVVPLFPDAAARGSKDTDFNDLMRVAGLDAVREQCDPAAIMGAPAVVAGTDLCEREPVQGESAPPAPSGEPEEGSIPHIEPHGDEEVESWTAGLKRTDKGQIKPVLANIVQILRRHPDWDGVLGFDQYAELIMKVGAPPWETDAPSPYRPAEWSEVDDYKFRLWLSARWFDAKEKDIMQAVTLVARENTFHPLLEELEAVPWDGTSRLRTWMIDYLGACRGKEFERLSIEEQDRIRQYVEKAGMKWMIGAVARVCIAARPCVTTGAQMDNMLILEGEQGIMKSTALRVLGGDWFTEEKLDFGNKDSFLVLQGRWIIEMAELEGMNKADSSLTKQFLTKREDLFREPYGRKLQKKPRRCVFAGTVNHAEYLRDDSGNRRFWPVWCEQIDIERLKQDRAQLWAEALHRYREGIVWWVTAEERKLFAIEADKRYQEDAWHGLVVDYLIPLTEVEMEDLLADAIKLDKPRWDKMALMRVGSIMRRLGWLKRRRRVGNGQKYYYARPDADPVKPAGDDDAPF